MIKNNNLTIVYAFSTAYCKEQYIEIIINKSINGFKYKIKQSVKKIHTVQQLIKIIMNNTNFNKNLVQVSQE